MRGMEPACASRKERGVHMSLSKRVLAELIGTFWLVFCGCGAAVIAANFPETGVHFVGIALAFGLAVLTAAYAFGAISGAHFNPAITLGVAVAKRFPTKEIVPYVVAQVAGAILGAVLLLLIANSAPFFDPQVADLRRTASAITRQADTVSAPRCSWSSS